MYYGIPRSVVEKYVSLCATCQLRNPQVTTAPLKPIIANRFLSRLQVNYCLLTVWHLYKVFCECYFKQIDLIDKRHLPDGDKKWILHGVDHRSKFNFAYGIHSKQAIDVAFILNTHIFPYFGVPKILHSDNGRKFVNKVIDELLRTWHSEIQLVSGRPRHPQSRGLVERVHYTLQRKLAAENNRTKLKQPPWNSWLPCIACKLLYVYFFQI